MFLKWQNISFCSEERIGSYPTCLLKKRVEGAQSSAEVKESMCVCALKDLEPNLQNRPFSDALLWQFPLVASEIKWVFPQCRILMLRLNCNNELDHVQLSCTDIKRAEWKFRDRNGSSGISFTAIWSLWVMSGLQSMEFEGIYNRK